MYIENKSPHSFIQTDFNNSKINQETKNNELDDINYNLSCKIHATRSTLISILELFSGVISSVMNANFINNNNQVNIDSILKTDFDHSSCTFSLLSSLCDQVILHYQPVICSLNTRKGIQLNALLSSRKYHESQPVRKHRPEISEAMIEKLIELVQKEKEWISYRNRLITNNIGLVSYISKQYKGGFIEHEDILQEGQVGLIKAVDRFDHTLGYHFSTYAFNWIRVSISRMIAQSERIVHLPHRKNTLANKVYRARETMEKKLGKPVSNRQIAQSIDISISELENILLKDQLTVSLDVPLESDGKDASFVDLLEQNIYENSISSITKSEIRATLRKALSSLSTKEAQVICLRFAIDCNSELTLQEIGNELYLSRERVRQIQSTALKKIKELFSKHYSGTQF